MKRALYILLLLTSTAAFGQFSKNDMEVMKIIRSRDSIPRSVFLDSTLLPDMNVGASNTKQYWVYNGTTGNHISQLFDIRLKFATHDSALWFHKKYLYENSEGGPKVKKHRLSVPGAEGLLVYEAPELLDKMVAMSGHRMFCYLFVVDSYFVKIYIVCNKEYKVNKFQDLAVEAVKRIKG